MKLSSSVSKRILEILRKHEDVDSSLPDFKIPKCPIKKQKLGRGMTGSEKKVFGEICRSKKNKRKSKRGRNED